MNLFSLLPTETSSVSILCLDMCLLLLSPLPKSPMFKIRRDWALNWENVLVHFPYPQKWINHKSALSFVTWRPMWHLGTSPWKFRSFSLEADLWMGPLKRSIYPGKGIVMRIILYSFPRSCGVLFNDACADKLRTICFFFHFRLPVEFTRWF